MTLANKWIYSQKRYVPYLLPPRSATYCSDHNEDICCAQCGKLMHFGDSYTSKEIHSSMGFGYGVCLECYENEIAAERGSNETNE